MMRAALTLGLLAAPAAAMPPPLFFCENADGTRVENLQIPDEDARFAFGYGASTPEERDFEIIMNCRRGGALFFAIDVQNPKWTKADDALQKAHNAFSDEGTPYKLKRLARQLKRHGARAEVREFSRTSCACDPDAYRQY